MALDRVDGLAYGGGLEIASRGTPGSTAGLSMENASWGSPVPGVDAGIQTGSDAPLRRTGKVPPTRLATSTVFDVSRNWRVCDHKYSEKLGPRRIRRILL